MENTYHLFAVNYEVLQLVMREVSADLIPEYNKGLASKLLGVSNSHLNYLPQRAEQVK